MARVRPRFPRRGTGTGKGNRNTRLLLPSSSVSNGELVLEVMKSLFSFLLLLCRVTSIFELLVFDLVMSAVWQICHTQWLPTWVGRACHWLCHLVIIAAHCIGSDCILIHPCDDSTCPVSWTMLFPSRVEACSVLLNLPGPDSGLSYQEQVNTRTSKQVYIFLLL